jgi:hypothetical protein
MFSLKGTFGRTKQWVSELLIHVDKINLVLQNIMKIQTPLPKKYFSSYNSSLNLLLREISNFLYEIS